MKRHLAAVMALDVVGYSRLMGEDERGTFEKLKDHRESVIAPAIATHNGRIVKLMGDGALIEFSSVVAAVEAAITIQRNTQERSSIRLRIGINLGDVIEDDDDIYGDGVNLAARLEALAEPGGLCISALAFESLEKKVAAAFVDHGRHQVKNIERPVHVYRWSREEAGATLLSASGGVVPSKPSIAVLPFANMSGDREQEYFSDGVSEDIITELSRFSELVVIARNSSFVFKGQNVDLREAANQLGVQYIVEGSVRKAGNRVRVTAQLIDAAAGSHIWADRYDRLLEDIFDVQDDVVRAIVAVLPGRIAAAGTVVSKRKPASNLTAFDYLLRGNHVLVRRGERIRVALTHFHKAIEVDPEYPAAHAGIAIAEGMSIWDLSTFNDHPLERALEYGKRAVDLDPDDYRCNAAYGEALRQAGHHEDARHYLGRARQLNPNSAQVMGFWAMLQGYTGEPAGAIETYHAAARLDPFSQDNLRKEILAESYYNLRDYQASIEVLKAMLKLPIFYAHQQIAIAYAQMGELKAMEHHMAAYRANLPDSYDEILLFESHMRLCALEEDREHWREGYRKTGLDV